jgi:hypothetical protein
MPPLADSTLNVSLAQDEKRSRADSAWIPCSSGDETPEKSGARETLGLRYAPGNRRLLIPWRQALLPSNSETSAFQK